MVSGGAGKQHYIDEVIGTAVFLFGLLMGVALLTYHPQDPSFSTVSSASGIHNAVGRIGAVFSDFLFQTLGAGAYAVPVFFLVFGLKRIQSDAEARRARVLICGFFVITMALSSLMSLGWKAPFEPLVSPMAPNVGGGALGEILSRFFLRYFATAGTYIIFTSLLLIGSMLAFPVSPKRMLAFGMRQLQSLRQGLLQRRRAERKRSNRRNPEAAPGAAKEEDAGDLKSFPELKPLPPPTIASLPQQEIFDFAREDLGDYRLPPLSLLADPPLATGSVAQQELIAQSQVLQKKLLDFGIEGRVTQVHPGPVITMFEFEPAPGIKLNRITNLCNDLALGMRAMSVRIVAPLPGKAAVGIEIPNLKRESVFLKEILASPGYNRLDSNIRLALGKDIFGNPVSADLAKMPHLLIAGATGAGKSVGLNGMILSLLFSATPAEVKLLMIDPKMLEFSLYDGIPHLITPVIVRPKAAAGALKKMVAEMQRRYELLSESGVRSINDYNKLASKNKEMEPLPYIVVMIDELADLMMVSARDVEDAIARLAQMARAAGIHLILATQRPSVDVLTGLIKANFPARIAFNVSSKIDSRTILDASGAEQLLGKGDMLYLSAGTGKLNRVHGAYISEEEVKKVVSFIKDQSQPNYQIDFSETSTEGDGRGGESSDERDERYEDARELVISTGQASASFIQRRMRVGYPRAARMIEMMEEDGLIGPAIGSKPREILIRKEEGESR